MLSNPLRAALLASALSLIALVGGPIVTANAVVESSQITSPADPTNAFYDETAASPEVITVAGTTVGSGEVDVRCYYGAGTNAYRTIKAGLVVSGNVFSLPVEASSLDFDQPCILRAVPAGDTTAHPPGSSTDPFQGPRIAASRFELFKNGALAPYDYDLTANDLSSYLAFDSAGSCGLSFSNLVTTGTLEESAGLFDCDAYFSNEDSPPSGSPTRSDLQIDGTNAYSPATAHHLESTLSTTGAPLLAVTQHYDISTGLATIEEVDPIVECFPEAAVFPPTKTSCEKFVSTGVQLERSWQTSAAGSAALLTDTWRSTDGAAHSLDALYNNEFEQENFSAGKGGGAFEFQGTSTFSPTAKGQALTLPAGAGLIYYKEDAETPASGDGTHPQGAIVYDSAPDAALVISHGSQESSENSFEMPYRRTIPAGGTFTLRMAFAQANTLPEVQSLISGALASEVFASDRPALTITAPANGTTVATPSVTVSGTASDSEGAPMLTVNGHAVSVGAGGAWSTSVALNQGANTITAVATDQIGIATQKSVTVTYTPPPPPQAHAAQVGSAKGANGEVSFTIACSGAAGTSCEVDSTLSTVEQTRKGKPVAVSAKRHRPRTGSKKLTVGSSKLTIPAGQRVTIAIKLNAAGKSLLARFGHLPVHLTAVLVSAGHRSTIITQNITVKPRKAKHKKHRH